MTIRSSGLWCDLCNKPIMDDPYWNIGINGKEGHSCKWCKEEHDKKDVVIIKEPNVTSTEQENRE